MIVGERIELMGVNVSVKGSNKVVDSNSLGRKILNISLDVIFVILFLISIVLVFNFISLKTGKVKYAPFGAYIIVSNSMVPTINVYDAVIIKKTDVKKLNKGDIITFASSDSRYLGYTITHRIYEVLDDSRGNVVFRTKGDNNNSVDSAPVVSSNVFGKVVCIVPLIGKLQALFRNPFGWILLVIVPFGIMIFFDVFHIIKERSS